MPPERLARGLAHAGFVLVAHELMKSMIVGPIKSFYSDMAFHDGPFKSYDEDVRPRDKNEFEACLLYLRDFLKAIDDADMKAIQALRQHRNDVAHDLVPRLATLRAREHRDMWVRAERALYRLSKHRAYTEIGADPDSDGLDWGRLQGHEYAIFEAIVEKIGILSEKEAQE